MTDDPSATELVPVEPPLEGVAERLLPAPDGDAARDLAQHIRSTHDDALADRVEWEGRLAQWEDQYHERLPEKDFPWPGAANFSVPLTAIGVDTYRPRLVESVLGHEPPAQVVPVESTDDERRDRAELLLNWQLRTELEIRDVVNDSAYLFLIPGTVVVKTTWRVERRPIEILREYPIDTPLEVMLQGVVGAAAIHDLTEVPGESLHWRGTLRHRPGAGGDVPITLSLAIVEDSEMVRVRAAFEEVTERPDVGLIEPPDFIAPTKGGADVQVLPWCEHRLWMSEADLRARARTGQFSAAAVERLLTQVQAPSGDSNQQDATGYREGLSTTEGTEPDGASSVRADLYEILERYEQWDVRDDGQPISIVAWLAPELPDELLGWDTVANVYAHGRRPFRVGRAFPIPFRFLGQSFAEVVRGIEQEATTIHNQRVDYGTIQNLPFYFYRASSSLAPFPAQLKPGEGVPVDNPQSDIAFPKWQGTPAFGQQEEALLLQYYERRTGLSDLTLGRQPTRVGATRTAAGTQSLLSEAGLRQRSVIEAFQALWAGVFEDVLALDQQYLPPGKEFRVTGRMPERIRLADRTEIAGRFDIRIAAASQATNRVVQREDALAMYQLLLNPALVQGGLVGLRGVRRALADVLRAFGRDPDAYLELGHVPLGPEEELATLVSGGSVRPVVGINVQEHLMYHQQQLGDPTIRGALGPDGIRKLQQLIADEIQLAQSQRFGMMLGGAGPQGPAGPAAPGDAREGQAGRQAPQPNAQPGTQTTLPAPQPVSAAGA